MNGQRDDPSTDKAVLQKAAALGFDHLMVSSEGAAQALVSSARAAGLAVLLELSPDRPAEADPVWQAHPQWRDSPALHDDLPDPRQPPQAVRHAQLRFDLPCHGQGISDWWVKRLSALAAEGVAGFCLRLDGPAPASFFNALIAGVKAAVPGCRFLAWTPGLPAWRVEALASCGFDAAFSSSAWWDFKAGWLQDEAQRLQPFGSVISLASTGPVSAIDPRTLWSAVMTGDGMMVTGRLAQTDSPALRQALALCRDKTSAQANCRWQLLSAPGAPVAVLHAGFSDSDPEEQLVMVANTTTQPALLDFAAVVSRFDGLALVNGYWPASEAPEAGTAVTLQGGETLVYTARPTRAATVAPKESRRGAEVAARAPRISIEDISPSIDAGRFVSKRNVGELLTVEADIFGEGHDRIAAALLWRAVDEEGWTEVPMDMVVNDRWRAAVVLPRVGRYQYQVEAWLDVFGAYRNELDKKTEAGQQVSLEIREGILLVKAALRRAEQEERRQLVTSFKRVIKSLDEQRDDKAQISLLLSDDVHQLMKLADARAFRVRSTPILQVDAERMAAGFSSWYELFPRSMGPDASTHGTFLDVIRRMPDIQAMGFDTLYFPPIHPIGLKHRKGPNNTLTAGPGDPGSPYAIGSADGGHDAIHPELGTLEDFRTMRLAAEAHGLELALDFAIQCAPDHPWLKTHPDWFTWRPDGTIRYAENPPKKYQDIVNVDFYAEGAVPGLWIALRDVVLFWVREGVKVFRVDNPHTKPMPFWEWLIGDVRARYPDTIFLAEAFTRPKPMYRLAKVGFSQSYSYFTWRHTKQEFIDYLTELTQGPPRDFFRPHFFVNTPDINPYFLQRSGRAGFVIRAALAATLSGLWGLYSGFELCEAAPVPGKEEYLDSEKYQLRQRDWQQPGNIVREVTLLNKARRANPALQSHVGVRFCQSTGEDILCFTKTASGTPAGNSNILLVAICLDPHAAHECRFELPLEDWGLPEGASVACEDLVNGNFFTLTGRHHTLRLDPADLAFTIWRLRPEGNV